MHQSIPLSYTKATFYEIVAPEQIEKVVKQAELLMRECREYQSDPENQNYKVPRNIEGV